MVYVNQLFSWPTCITAFPRRDSAHEVPPVWTTCLLSIVARLLRGDRYEHPLYRVRCAPVGCAFRSVCLESAQSLSLKDTFASLAIIFTLLFSGLLFVFPFVCQLTEELYYFLTYFSCHSVLSGTGQASGE